MNIPAFRLSAVARPPVARRAFTLIELLTVIAIIGILAAIIIPTVGKVRQSAHRAACASNLRQMAMAFHMFAEERRTMPVYEQWFRFDAVGANGLRDYVDRNRNVFVSPVAARTFPPRTDAPNTYALNAHMSSDAPEALGNFTRVRERSRAMLFMLGNANAPQSGGFNYRPAIRRAPGSAFRMDNTGVDGSDRFLDSGYSNIVYADGHVSRISREEAIRLANGNEEESNLFWTGNP